MKQEVLTPQEIADLLKIKKTTVYEMIKRGDLSATKLGKQLRISKDELDRFLSRIDETPSSPIQSSAPNMPYQDNDSSPIILCGQDILLDILSNKINSNTFRPNVLRSYLGSYNGLYSMYQGQAHLATAHLWDMETDSYNLPFASKLLPGVRIRIYHLIKRMQGFYVAKGNPKKIKDFNDLSRSDIRYVNREKGSGTRILLDSMLTKLSILPRQLPGYYNEVNSHLAAASSIARFEADYGLGTAKACKDLDSIEFIPLKEESYDLFVLETEMEHPIVKQIIATIQSKEFRHEIDLLGNYNTEHMGERIL